MGDLNRQKEIKEHILPSPGRHADICASNQHNISHPCTKFLQITMQNEGAKQVRTQASRTGFCGDYIWYAMSQQCLTRNIRSPRINFYLCKGRVSWFYYRRKMKTLKVGEINTIYPNTGQFSFLSMC